jgi:hypothetical protein
MVQPGVSEPDVMTAGQFPAASGQRNRNHRSLMLESASSLRMGELPASPAKLPAQSIIQGCPMPDVRIENPILNSPFAAERHFKFTDEVITNESVDRRRYGKLAVLLARMNPDLLIGSGDESLLKNSGAGNLFMVFGEPDIDIRKNNGKITVELKGLDVYNPTTGQIRNSSTDDIACWFIDTDYNGESFFVRQAYFTGADEPYEKLNRALKAEIDEAAWSSLYSTTSRRFPNPESGKIAVKVLNHYGDEGLKVIVV